VFTDAASTPSLSLGVYYPPYGWLFHDWSSNDKHDIAMVEFLAHVIGYVFTIHVNPSCKHVHLWIDNKNAQAWSGGRIKTDANFSTNLCFFNSFLQGSYRNCTQTRDYIPTKANKIADSISRRDFCMVEAALPRYHLSKSFIDFLQQLSTLPNSTLSLQALTELIVAPSRSFSSFSEKQI
jgi:hypothetical protein